MKREFARGLGCLINAGSDNAGVKQRWLLLGLRVDARDVLAQIKSQLRFVLVMVPIVPLVSGFTKGD